jgi:hypothetical protein
MKQPRVSALGVIYTDAFPHTSYKIHSSRGLASMVKYKNLNMTVLSTLNDITK